MVAAPIRRTSVEQFQQQLVFTARLFYTNFENVYPPN